MNLKEVGNLAKVNKVIRAISIPDSFNQTMTFKLTKAIGTAPISPIINISNNL
jgi:hypothetical protein